MKAIELVENIINFVHEKHEDILYLFSGFSMYLASCGMVFQKTNTGLVLLFDITKINDTALQDLHGAFMAVLFAGLAWGTKELLNWLKAKINKKNEKVSK
jgi:hypothetical protein